jgi:predicted lipoprotein with Yx(FWY)xxD motif
VPATRAPDTVKTADTTLGKILVDAKGMTLYYFANDIPASGASSCYGQCAVAWPIFSVDTVTVSSPLLASDFSSITRTDGTKQTTYRGWPLYYWQADKKPGDATGENVNKIWFVVKPDETVMIANRGATGLFLTDTLGKTLYYFTSDTSGASTCTNACLARWPAFNADTISAPSVLRPADFTKVTRADGVKQTAYMNRPLYYFVNDTKPGDILGQGFNNVWYVANISGNVPVVTTVPITVPTTVRTTSPASGGGGGGGGY